MDRRQLSFPNSLAADESDPKLTRASSLTDFSGEKFTFEERYHSQTCDNLVKQFDCKAIFDKQAKKSQCTVSQRFKSGNQEHLNVWKNEVYDTEPYNINSWTRTKSSPQIKENFLVPIERLSLTDMNSSDSKNVLASPKLILDDSESQQSNSNSQNSQNSFQRTSSVLSRYESCDDSFSFKKPLTPSKDSSFVKKRFIVKDDCNASKNDTLELPNTSHAENEEIEKYNVKRLKKRLRSLVAPTQVIPKQQRRLYISWTVLVLLILVSTLCSMYILSDADLFKRFCDPHFEINNIPEELSKLVHGQSSGVMELGKLFTRIDNTAGFNILVLLGGIGVGKSYTSEIIRSNLKETTKVLDFFPPLYTKESQAYSSLSICKCNLIRLDNLKSDDIVDAVKFASFLKEKVKTHCVLVLAIFNLEEIDHNLKRSLNLDKSSLLIKSKFEEANLKPTIVNYVSLSDEALEKCIEDLADYANIELTSDDFASIKNHLKDADSGCKGAYAKIQITGNAVRNH